MTSFPNAVLAGAVSIQISEKLRQTELNRQSKEMIPGHWANLLANLGVVLGLVFLAYELHQTNKLAETQAYVDRLDQMQQAATAYAESNYLADLYVKIGTGDMFNSTVGEKIHELTEQERARLNSWERGVMLRMSGHYHQYLRGYIDQETADKILRDARSRLERWNALGIEIEGKELRTAILDR